MTPLPTLSLLQARVLGVLIEKQRTVPDTYPLTLNAIVAGCNQKTSRDPVLAASDAEVQAAVDHLKSLSLVIESSGGRVARYEHNAERVLQLPPASTAAVAVLMLRGPQTVGELRINTERLHRFTDIAAVEDVLTDLATRPAGALAVELPRRPGDRENRWTQLLSGLPQGEIANVAATSGPQSADVSVGELAALRSNVARLETEVAHLKSTVAKLCAELGIAPP